MTSRLDSASIPRVVGQDAMADSSPEYSMLDGEAHTTVRPDPDNPDMLIVRTRKKKRKRRSRRRRNAATHKLRVVLIVFGALVAVCIIAVFAIGSAIRSGDQNLHAAANSVEDSAKTVRYGGHVYQFNENIVSVVVLGIDDESDYAVRSNASCADTNMLVTLDTQTMQTNVVFIPRDTMVDMEWKESGRETRIINAQLATAYAIDAEGDEDCAKNSMRSVSRIFYNLPLNQYFVFTPDSVKRITAAVGGVPLTAEIDDPKGAFSAGDDVLLQGDSAWRYLKWRSTEEDASAESRLVRQQHFVQAFLAKATSLSVTDLLNLYTSVQAATFTNLDVNDVAYLASCFVQGGKANLSYTLLDGRIELEEDSDGVEREHVYLDEDSTMKATLAAFYKQVS